jgi:hypothetical protein
VTHVWPIYGAAMVAITVRAWWVADRILLAAALVLLADWLASNLSRWFLPFDYRLIFQPSDFMFGLVFILMWARYERPWLAVVSALYIISGITGVVAYGPGSKFTYDLALNAAFLARLAVVWIASFEPRNLRNAHDT